MKLRARLAVGAISALCIGIVIGLSVRAGRVAAGPKQLDRPARAPNAGLEQDTLVMEFYAAIGADGPLYRRFRDRIVARGRSAVPFLQEKRKKGRTWQERTMAEMLLERILKADVVARLTASPPRVTEVRSIGRAYRDYGKELADAFVDAPMLLVEAIWKDQELYRKSVPQIHPDAQRLFAICAFQHLKDPRALDVLIWVIRTDEGVVRPHAIWLTADALGALGDPRAVPALLQALGREPSSLAMACAAAVERCVNEHTRGLVYSYARFFLDEAPRRGRALLNLVKQAETPNQ